MRVFIGGRVDPASGLRKAEFDSNQYAIAITREIGCTRVLFPLQATKAEGGHDSIVVVCSSGKG
jgi:hypothetical protein